MGIGGLFAFKAGQYRDMLKDALKELQEWGEEDSGSEEDEDDDAAGSENEDMFGDGPSIPKSDPDGIRPRLEFTLKQGKLLVTMYNAVIKRRFQTLTPTVPAIQDQNRLIVRLKRMDLVLEILRNIPDILDELATEGFYDLSPGLIDRLMHDIFEQSVLVTKQVGLNWDAKEDEFTTWATKFRDTMKERWDGMAELTEGVRLVMVKEA